MGRNTPNPVGKLDKTTRAKETIEYEHHEVHAGDSYISDVVDTSMGDGDTLVLAFKTPNTTKWAHMVVSGWCKTAGHVDIIEAPTWTTGTGSQNPIYNRDRNSSNTSVLLEDTTGTFTASSNMVLNPTGESGGTVIHDFYMGTDKKTGGEIPRGIAEFILKQNTAYIIKLTADAASSAGQIILNWYEHTNL